MTKLVLIKFFFLLIFAYECMCCSRSKRYVQNESENEKLNPINSELVRVEDSSKNKSILIEESAQQSRFECKEPTDIFCYNNGKCFFEYIKFNETYELRITYCECEKGFSGKTCREDDRFLMANISIIIFIIIASVVLIFIIIGGLFYRYHKRKMAHLKTIKEHQNEQNTELLPKPVNSVTCSPSQTANLPQNKKKVTREISSISEKLGKLVEEKNKNHNERKKLSESQHLKEQDDEQIHL